MLTLIIKMVFFNIGLTLNDHDKYRKKVKLKNKSRK